MELDRERHFTPAEIEVVTALGEQAAIAIHNGKLIESLRETNRELHKQPRAARAAERDQHGALLHARLARRPPLDRHAPHLDHRRARLRRLHPARRRALGLPGERGRRRPRRDVAAAGEGALTRRLVADADRRGIATPRRAAPRRPPRESSCRGGAAGVRPAGVPRRSLDRQRRRDRRGGAARPARRTGVQRGRDRARRVDLPRGRPRHPQRRPVRERPAPHARERAAERHREQHDRQPRAARHRTRRSRGARPALLL